MEAHKLTPPEKFDYLHSLGLFSMQILCEVEMNKLPPFVTITNDKVFIGL